MAKPFILERKNVYSYFFCFININPRNSVSPGRTQVPLHRRHIGDGSRARHNSRHPLYAPEPDALYSPIAGVVIKQLPRQTAAGLVAPRGS